MAASPVRSAVRLAVDIPVPVAVETRTILAERMIVGAMMNIEVAAATVLSHQSGYLPVPSINMTACDI
jgi:hypothetical protein